MDCNRGYSQRKWEALFVAYKVDSGDYYTVVWYTLCDRISVTRTNKEERLSVPQVCAP